MSDREILKRLTNFCEVWKRVDGEKKPLPANVKLMPKKGKADIYYKSFK